MRHDWYFVPLTAGTDPIEVNILGYNPICPMGVYMADPSAKVMDGKLYVACSLDLTTDYWCSAHHSMLSTEDMLHWTLHPNVFASAGPDDEVSYSDAARACLFNGGPYVRLMEGRSGREILSGAVDGSKAAWKYVDFDPGLTKMTVRVRALAGGSITVAQDQSFHGRIASLYVPAGNGEWVTLSCDVKDVREGSHALWFMFSGPGGSWKEKPELFEIDWMVFE